MKKIKVDNIRFIDHLRSNAFFPVFTVASYTFSSKNSQPDAGSGERIYNSRMAIRDNRVHTQSAYVRFEGKQLDSIIFKNGETGAINHPKKRKKLEDVLLIGSLLTRNNWSLYSRRGDPQYPTTPTNHLLPLCHNPSEVEDDFRTILPTIEDPAWQAKYHNGFQLIFLLNNSNILNIEARFLSNIVIWELLYSQVFGSEEDNLSLIIEKLMEHYFLGRKTYVLSRRTNNFYTCLRNQLAHNGRLPINRNYAEQWMKDLSIEDNYKYIDFFGHLTQYLVLRTINIDAENRPGFDAHDFKDRLDKFLLTGKII